MAQRYKSRLPDESRIKEALEELAPLMPVHGRKTDVESIAEALGLTVTICPLDNVEALLIRGARKIVVAGDSSRHRRRFAVAHELAHWILHGAGGALQICTEWDLLAGDRNKEEGEANQFASHLLMPSHKMDSFWRTGPGSLQLVKHIASVFDVSLTAAAIRYIEIAETPAVLVISDESKVLFSRATKNAPDVIRAGQRLPAESVIANQRRADWPSRPTPFTAVAGRAWNAAFPAEIEEDSAWMPKPGFGVTLLFLEPQGQNAWLHLDDDAPLRERRE